MIEINLEGQKLKMRFEKDGVYSYIKSYGKTVCFNFMGFEVIQLMAMGKNTHEIAEVLAEKYSVRHSTMQCHIVNYQDYLRDLQLIV